MKSRMVISYLINFLNYFEVICQIWDKQSKTSIELEKQKLQFIQILGEHIFEV